VTGELPLVAVQHRPVDEEQTPLGAGLARRLPNISGLATLDGIQGKPFRKVGVPQQVVIDERAPRAEEDRQAVRRRQRRQFVEQVGERAFECACEHRVSRQLS
jgi:hypothetical protein